jgi:hypothetical protein
MTNVIEEQRDAAKTAPVGPSESSRVVSFVSECMVELRVLYE